MAILEILAPILLIVLLGVGLARMRWLGGEAMGGMNWLVFWVLLPASIFRLAALNGDSGPESVAIVAVLLIASLVVAMAGWMASVALKLPRASHGSLAQSTFRGNLAFVGIPVLVYALEGTERAERHLATAGVAMVLLIAAWNLMAVMVLQAGRGEISMRSLGPGLRSIVTNPLLISCAAGLLFNAMGLELPVFADRLLNALGSASVPIALLCIGGSIAFIRLGNHVAGIGVAVALKLVAVPLLVLAAGRFFALDAVALRIALVFAACPVAASAFIMARQMEGDESLTSGAIVLSTIFSALSLAAVLWITQ
jgi:predicted permease